MYTAGHQAGSRGEDIHQASRPAVTTGEGTQLASDVPDTYTGADTPHVQLTAALLVSPPSPRSANWSPPAWRGRSVAHEAAVGYFHTPALKWRGLPLGRHG
jgi:hypothetical protein